MLNSSTLAAGDRTASKNILIVGAGPTGLTMANALSEYGVSFSIIEKRSHLSNSSKGLSLNISSQISLDNLGLKEAIIDEGCQIKRLHLSLDGKRASTVDFTRLESNQYLITQPQSLTEKKLFHCLLKRKQEVLWGHQLESIEKKANYYSAGIRLPNGEVTYNKFDYIIGCDGKHSLVREAIGAEYEGEDYNKNFVLGDFEMEEEFSKNDVYYNGSNHDFYILIPISNRHCRFVMVTDEKHLIGKDIDSFIKQSAQHHLGKQKIKKDSIWSSYAKIYLRMVNKLKKDRLFLCGDSAHLVSPIGGTGMNMGIQDAMNLAYKLAYSYHGLCNDDILMNYETERLPEIRKTCLQTNFMTQLIIDENFRNENIDRFLPKMSNRPLLNRTFPESFSGLTLQYQKYEIGGKQPTLIGSLYPLRMDIIDNFDQPNKRLKTIVIVSTPEKNSDLLLENLQNLYKNLNKNRKFFYIVMNNAKSSFWIHDTTTLINKVSPPKKEGIFIINPESIIEEIFRYDDIFGLMTFLKKNYFLEDTVKEMD